MDRVLVGVSTPSRASILSIALAVWTACATVPERQVAIPVEMGQRVRVTLASRVATGPLQGTVVSVSPDTLLIAREEGGERRLSRRQVEEVEVSVSRTVEPMKAAGYGIVAAAPFLVLATLFAPIVAGESDASLFAIIFVPVGVAAGIGAVIGSGPQDVWVEAIWPSSSAPASPDSLHSESR